jgi:hypothetical protein
MNESGNEAQNTFSDGTVDGCLSPGRRKSIDCCQGSARVCVPKAKFKIRARLPSEDYPSFQLAIKEGDCPDGKLTGLREWNDAVIGGHL